MMGSIIGLFVYFIVRLFSFIGLELYSFLYGGNDK